MQQHRQQTSSTASIAYAQHRDYVLAVLGHRCGWLDPSDREALVHDAYTVLLEKHRDGDLDVDDMRGPQIRAYLTQTALNKAMDEGKRACRRRSVSLDDMSVVFDPVAPGPDLDEQVTASLDRQRVREILANLPARQQAIITLRLLLDRTPDEIQRHLGVTGRVYRRELEIGLRQLSEELELHRRGTFCASRRSLLLACLNGVAGPRRVRAARLHLASCPACAGWLHQQAHPEMVEEHGPAPACPAPHQPALALADREWRSDPSERPPTALAA